MQIWLGSINLFWKLLWNVLRALTIQADLICLEKVSETTSKYSVLTQIYKLPNEINQLFFRGFGSWEAIKVDGQESQHKECRSEYQNADQQDISSVNLGEGSQPQICFCHLLFLPVMCWSVLPRKSSHMGRLSQSFCSLVIASWLFLFDAYLCRDI